MEFIDKDYVEEYINNEIDYINRYEDTSNKGTLLDLHYLHTLTEEDIKNITEKVNNDSELYDKINELIHYYVYHK